MATEQFDLHPAVAYSLIINQGASLEKAILEAVMNSADAGATVISITVTDTTLTITDDGRGFQNSKDIDLFFSTIGTPHTAGDSIFGTFRLGRCQLFAHGANLWRSNHFQMAVDVKANGLMHDVTTVDEHMPGCRITIELYEALTIHQQIALTNQVRKAVRWLNMTVTLNGVLLTTDMTQEAWTAETPQAFIRTTTEWAVAVYNQGIFVRDYPSSDLGAGGIIVSRVPLSLNAARNDVLVTCPEWKAIKALFAANLPRRKTRRQTDAYREQIHTEGGRTHYVTRLLNREVELHEALADRAGIIATAINNFAPLQQLAQPKNPLVTVGAGAAAEHQLLMKAGIASVILPITLADFRAGSLRDLIGILAAIANEESATSNSQRVRNFADNLAALQLAEWSSFASHFADNYLEISPSVLTKAQQRDLGRLVAMSAHCATQLQVEIRPIRPGKSRTRNSWTDGGTIYFDQDAIIASGSQQLFRAALQIIESYQTHRLNTDSVTPLSDEATAINETLLFSDLAGNMVTAALQAAVRESQAIEDQRQTGLSGLTEIATYQSLCASIAASAPR